MTAAPLPAELRLLAPVFAARFSALVTQLIGFIALRLGRHPRLASLTPMLCNRLNRAARIITRMMARLAQGRRPRIDLRRNRARSHTPHPPTPHPHNPAKGLPTSPGWLLRALKHEAALTRMHLETLLAEPGIADLMAEAPTLQRLLNPLRRALGIGHTPRPVKPPPPPPTESSPAESSAPQSQPQPARARFVHFVRIL